MSQILPTLIKAEAVYFHEGVPAAMRSPGCAESRWQICLTWSDQRGIHFIALDLPSYAQPPDLVVDVFVDTLKRRGIAIDPEDVLLREFKGWWYPAWRADCVGWRHLPGPDLEKVRAAMRTRQDAFTHQES